MEATRDERLESQQLRLLRLMEFGRRQNEMRSTKLEAADQRQESNKENRLSEQVNCFYSSGSSGFGSGESQSSTRKESPSEQIESDNGSPTSPIGAERREFDYSTLCRDEFSSFIEGSDLSDIQQQSAGPTLVGLDDSMGRNKDDLLDFYIKRVECLLRLTRGDRNVTMDEVFGEPHEQIKVSEENRTRVEFSDIKQKPRKELKVIQEIQFTSCDSDEEIEAESNRRKIEVELQRHSIEDNFRSILWAPQSTPSLDWTKSHSLDEPRDEVLKSSKEELRAAIVESLLSIEAIRSKRDMPNHLVSLIDQYLDKFLLGYLEYQRQLKSSAEFARDWRQNWFFAYRNDASQDQENQEPKSSKRPKIESNQCDLLRYSTLILSKRMPVTLTYLASDSDLNEPIERLYSIENPTEIPKRQAKGDLVDICQLLLANDFIPDDDYEDSPTRIDGKRKRRPRGKDFHVGYESSCLLEAQTDASSIQFSAYGYNIGLAKCRVPSSPRKLAQIRESILRKFAQIFNVKSRPKICAGEFEDEQVRFAIKPANVDLANRLKVIQFCGKLSGSLPIKVTWFRLSQAEGGSEQVDISDIFGANFKQGQRSRIKRLDRGPTSEDERSGWSIGLRANYDYEYQTDWSSWFRFRRSQNDILFEIRDPSDQFDFNRTYKCVIENYCSRQECQFRLTKQAQEEANEAMLRLRRLNAVKETPVGDPSSRAILRTWSQRTLNRPACSTTSVDFNGLIEPTELEIRREPELASNWRAGVSGESTVDKIDENFPYHPKNLLKRLKENKYSLTFQNVVGQGQSYELKLEDRLEVSLPEDTKSSSISSKASTQFNPSEEAIVQVSFASSHVA